MGLEVAFVQRNVWIKPYNYVIQNMHRSNKINKYQNSKIWPSTYSRAYTYRICGTSQGMQSEFAVTYDFVIIYLSILEVR